MATIKDVAKLAGVSTSTASRAMHDSEMISEATKERIRKAMVELDYSPNYSAQNLVNRKSNTVGIVLPVRENQNSLGYNPFFMQIIQGISSVCSENEYMVSLVTGHSDEELRKNTQTLIRSGNVTKLIFLYSKKGDLAFEFAKEQSSVSCLVVGQAFDAPSPRIRYVDNNNYQAGKDVASFLIDKGYNHICFAYTDLDELVQFERYNGFSVSMAEQGKSASILKLSEGDDKNSQALADFLEEHPDVQAFVASDDVLAIHIQRLLKQVNLPVKEMGLVGFNNSFITEIANPPLTSVEIFPYQLGEAAARLVLADQLSASPENTVIIPHQIIQRETSPRI